MCMCMKTSSMETDVDISPPMSYLLQTLMNVGENAKNDTAGMH